MRFFRASSDSWPFRPSDPPTLRLSVSVYKFLAEQGIDKTRMRSAGYGIDRPIADNSTVDGRKKNRRVEIIIAEGEVRGQ